MAGPCLKAGTGRIAPILEDRNAYALESQSKNKLKLVVGRNPGKFGLAVPGDKLLSRRHFTIRAEGRQLQLEDAGSHNGTAVNSPENRIQSRLLRNGDLLLAGNHLFVFLE